MTDSVFAVAIVGDDVVVGIVVGQSPSTLLVETVGELTRRRIERWRALLFDDYKQAQRYAKGLACEA